MPTVDLSQLQDVIERTFGERDRARGTAATVAWLAEEVGELAQAVRKGERAAQVHSRLGMAFSLIDTVFAEYLDLHRAFERYADGCPRCGQLPCACVGG